MVNFKPKILTIGSVPPPQGGISSVVESILNMKIINSKYKMLFLNRIDSRPAYVRGRPNVINIYFNLIQLIKYFRIMFRERPQIIHIHTSTDWGFYKDGVFLFIAKVLRKKTILHLHGATFDNTYDKSSWIGKWFIKKILELPNIDIALSKYDENFYKHISPNANIRVLNNGINYSSFNLSENNQQANRFNIFFIGLLGRRKGIYDILEVIKLLSFSKNKDIKFILAGDWESKEDKENILKLIKQKEINNFICFLGEIAGDKKIKAFCNADIFLFPSYAEGFPIALLEAMASGLPVITTPVGGIPELVEDGVNGFLVKPGDINSMVDKIIELFRDEKSRKLIRNNNMDKIRKYYAIEKIDEELNKIYDEVLE